MAEKESCIDVEIDSAANLCFLTKIENDLQHVFNHVYSKFPAGNKSFHVKKLLKKGSIFHKGDFFLSLRSDYIFFSDDVKDELLMELNEIPYICESEIDEDGNLNLCLNRSVVFKSVLRDVMKYGEQYGMKTTEKSYLILVHNEVFKNFDALRIAIIADHLISFLSATGAKVFVNEFRKDAELFFNKVPTYVCTDACLQQMKILCESIESLAQDSDWCSVINDAGNIVVDLKKFIKAQSIHYGKDADNVTITKNIPNTVVNQSAYTTHFHSCHVVTDYIIHICSHTQRRKIIDSGLLIEMLNLLDVPQIFITCQTTVYNEELEASVDTFMAFQKSEIEKAMHQRFSSNKLTTIMWDRYMNTLVDTATKFYFLRAGTNVPLKIDLLFGQSNTRNNRDGIFIEYNFARLSILLKTFELKVKDRFYESLPQLDEIDFSLLKFEEEWNLLNYISAFPRLVQEIFWSINTKHLFPVSKICIMLTKLCSCFSIYYSRIHILGGQQLQLQKVMFARLWLLKGIYQIMCNSFILLNIKGLSEM